jgi:hypothetical protein
MTIQYNFINSSNNNKKRKTEAASLLLLLLSGQPAMFAARQEVRLYCTIRAESRKRSRSPFFAPAEKSHGDIRISSKNNLETAERSSYFVFCCTAAAAAAV